MITTKEITHGEGKEKTIEVLEYLSDYNFEVFQIG